MKTATRNVFVMFATLSTIIACQFTPDTYDQDYLDSLKGSGGLAQVNLSRGGAAADECPVSCDRISIQSYKPRTGFAPSKRTLGLNDGDLCVCPNGSGGTSSTNTGVAGASGDGSTQDPPQGGTTGTTDYPSLGGATASNGGTTSVETATGGDGNTQDPPGTGGNGNTQDPPGVGGGSTQDPPGTGGTSSTGGTSATGGTTSLGEGGGSTQDPPQGGTAGMAGVGGGSTQDPPGVGGGTTQDPPGTGGKTSTGGASSTGGTSATGGSSATGGKTGTGGGTSCEKQSYKFYVTEAQEGLGSGTVSCRNLTTGAAPKSTTCSDASCCYYTIPTSCDKWACHQINQSEGMPRIPSYDPVEQKGILDWGSFAIITTGDHYWLEEGVDYEIVCTKIDAGLDCAGDLACEKQNHECDLVLNPNAGERFYQ